MNVLKIAFAAVCGVTFIFLAASTGGPTWIDYTGDASSGIFRSCDQLNLKTLKIECRNLDATKGESPLKATRAFTVLSVLATLVAVILALISFCAEKIPAIVPAILMGVAGFCALIGGAIFADEYGDAIKNNKDAEYGWSFALCWVGMVTAFISAALGFVAHKKK